MKTKLIYVVYTWLLIGASSCSLIRYNLPGIQDHKIFPYDPVARSENVFEFSSVSDFHLPPPYFWTVFKNGKVKDLAFQSLEDFLTTTNTTSFIVIRNDSILYERYFNGYLRDDKTQIFSITKAIMSTLVGIAMNEGFIKSLDQSVADFIPEFKNDAREKISLRHLLQMTSGLAFSDYSTYAKLVKMYFSPNQDELVSKIHLKREPGTRFEYSSMSTLILGICLEKATGQKVANYLEAKIWKPMGAEFDATFAKDEKGRAKFWGGLAARPIDLARFGRLYLNNGKQSSEQVIPVSWVMACRDRDTTCGSSARYNYAFWMEAPKHEDVNETHDFMATGFKGQMVYLNPDDNIIIIRTGEKGKGINWNKSLATLSRLPWIRNQHLPASNELSEAVHGIFQDLSGHQMTLNWQDNRLVCYMNDQTIALTQKTPYYFTNVSGAAPFHLLLDFKNKKARKIILQTTDRLQYFENKDWVAGH